MPDIDLLTEEEAAQYLRLTKAALQQRRFHNKQPSYVRIGGTIRYAREDLKKYVAEGRVQIPGVAAGKTPRG